MSQPVLNGQIHNSYVLYGSSHVLTEVYDFAAKGWVKHGKHCCSEHQQNEEPQPSKDVHSFMWKIVWKWQMKLAACEKNELQKVALHQHDYQIRPKAETSHVQWTPILKQQKK